MRHEIRATAPAIETTAAGTSSRKTYAILPYPPAFFSRTRLSYSVAFKIRRPPLPIWGNVYFSSRAEISDSDSDKNENLPSFGEILTRSKRAHPQKQPVVIDLSSDSEGNSVC